MNFGKLGLIVLSLLIAVVIVVARNQGRKDRIEPTGVASQRIQVTPTPESADSSQPAPSPASARDFHNKFGNSLEVVSGPSGKAVSIRGKPGQGAPAQSGFKPSDQESVASRVDEILETVQGMLGVESRSPLGLLRLKTSEVSAQAFFKQSFEGAEVAPYGNVTLDLGTSGEILSIDSDYVPALKSENSRTLTAEQARPGNATGGVPVFWVLNPNSGNGSATGRHAYEFFVEGRQIIRDASTGETIFERDRRKH